MSRNLPTQAMLRQSIIAQERNTAAILALAEAVADLAASNAELIEELREEKAAVPVGGQSLEDMLPDDMSHRGMDG